MALLFCNYETTDQRFVFCQSLLLCPYGWHRICIAICQSVLCQPGNQRETDWFDFLGQRHCGHDCFAALGQRSEETSAGKTVITGCDCSWRHRLFSNWSTETICIHY